MARSEFTARPDNAMNEQQLVSFLSEKREARLATTRDDGHIHLTPIWYTYRDGVIRFVLSGGRRHLDNLRRTHRATLLVDEDLRYKSGWSSGARAVMMAGTVDLNEDPDAVSDELRRLSIRYLGPNPESDAGYRDAPGRTAPQQSVATLRPDVQVSWHFAGQATPEVT